MSDSDTNYPTNSGGDVSNYGSPSPWSALRSKLGEVFATDKYGHTAFQDMRNQVRAAYTSGAQQAPQAALNPSFSFAPQVQPQQVMMQQPVQPMPLRRMV